MLTVQQLAERYHLGERQLHLRLNALGSLVQEHIFTEESGATLLDEHVITLFDQLIQMESKGLPTSRAVEQLRPKLVSRPRVLTLLDLSLPGSTPEGEALRRLQIEPRNQEDSVVMLNTSVTSG